MKKIDLHVHTIPTISDSHFTFSLDKLKDYVSTAKLDAIAITNHNTFNRSQFREINEAIDAIVFPGIEVSLESCHILIICDDKDPDDFEAKTVNLNQQISYQGDKLKVDKLEEIFGDFNEYLVIPHYDKKPAIRGEVLNRIADHVSAGEVDSAKKFIRATKDDTKLTPVLFSDIRIREDMEHFPTRQTFLDCGDLTLGAIKACLRDKSKVQLSRSDGNRLLQIFDDGQMLSTGLNVVLGERSSGKTVTLNKISEAHKRVKYIKQFELVQQDDEKYKREFKKDISRKRSQFSEKFLDEFKIVLNDVINIDLHQNERQVEEYINSLLKAADDIERRDAFSNTALFDETQYAISEDRVLYQLIASVRHLIENKEYRSIIDKHLDIIQLKALACELIETYWAKEFEGQKKKFVNDVVRGVREILRRRTAATSIEDLDLYQIKMDQRKVAKFETIVKSLQRSAVISKEDVQGFSVVTSKSPFEGPGEIKTVSGLKVGFSEPYKEYDNPYKYLQALKSNELLTTSEFYKYFVKIDYKILNKGGYEVSGGERSEFRLLQEIKDAQNYDFLLVDEPESSFDNLFLKREVNQILKEISKSMPVVVVTHNNTLGASIGADYLIYASKDIEESGEKFRLYSGHPTDRHLTSLDGKKIKNFDVTLNSLEAGTQAYDDRRQGYEVIKD